MTTPTEKKEFCKSESERFYQIGKDYFVKKRGLPESQFPPLRVDFFNGSSCAGLASGKLRENWVSYNTDFMNLEDGWEHISSKTIAHEVAHRIDCLVHGGYRTGKSGRRLLHDHVWKVIMERILGVKAQRCHNINIQSLKKKTQKTFKAVASCGCEFDLTSVRANRMKRGVVYDCGKHKKRLKLV